MSDDPSKPPIVGIDPDSGNWVILLSDGRAASFKEGAWHPGVLWDGRTICDFNDVSDSADIERVVAEAADALNKSAAVDRSLSDTIALGTYGKS